jgi:hypothetical protein
MPHYKCGACRVRVNVPRASAELVENLCPECGSPLEPVAELAELMGFRSIEPLAAEQWLNDGDGRLAGAIALPPPPTYL